MNAVTNKTERLHLGNPFLSSCMAQVIAIDPEQGIVLDRTVAYAEGGGQEGDRGVLEISADSDKVIPFIDAQKGSGRLLMLNDFPSIHVDTPVYHKVEEENLHHFHIGLTVRIKIDVERRAKLTVSHTGIHLVLMGLESIYPDIYSRIIGCHIKETGARLDFSVEEKMTAEDILQAQEFANHLILSDLEMQVFANEMESEAYYWRLNDTVYPCGGTHLNTTAAVGTVEVRKKNMGRGKQRVSFSFPNAILPTCQYYNE